MELTPGNTALVTGASFGIGAEFARQLAAKRLHLVLVARSSDRLEALAAELRSAHGIRVDVVVADLAATDAVPGLVSAIAASGAAPIDVLVNNAGLGAYGAFDASPAAMNHHQVMVNVYALVALTRELLPPMLARHHGAVVNLASTVAFQPLPFMALYAATKAFVLSFSEGLWGECEGRGVHVIAVCPGPVVSHFDQVAGTTGKPFLKGAIGADELVRKALLALEAGRMTTIVGTKNRLLATLTRFVPRRSVARVARRIMRKGAGRDAHQAPPPDRDSAGT